MNLILIPKDEEKQFCIGLTNAEFRCTCVHPSCRSTIIQQKTINAFAKFRTAIGLSVGINSGYRCILHNYVEGGKPMSRHTVGEAIDISYKTFKHLYAPNEVISLLKKCGFTFVLYYEDEDFFHADTREV